MRGDFSRLSFNAHDNFNGVLPQQGKVLLDADGIAQTLIANDWQQTATRDWVGDVAGVPQSEPNSFLVTKAALSGGVVTLTVDPGRLWAGGLLVRLHAPSGGTSVQRTATWLEPPLVPNEGSAGDVAAGTIDTVVLEVWQRAVSGFAMPEQLIEPALGGPDTAERLQTQCAFWLARLGAGQSCASLTYDESKRGTLTASLVPPVTVSGDCPLNASGGYSGFEHQLYRIEMIDTGGGPAAFKWSRVNGGLAGRGTFDPGTQKIIIDANLMAINSYNQSSFYLEIETWDSNYGFTRTISGSQAVLNAGVLTLDATADYGTYPTAAGDVFFRLWDGKALVSAYPIVSGATKPTLLENGIQLQFEADGPGKYMPGDYWTFPVRAQGIANPETLIDAKKPQGIVYHRVPLAEITWASDGAGGFAAGTIEDCRSPLFPISRRQGCCTYRVGDGVESFGEFTSIQSAIDALPATGGEICVLPGRYFENISLVGLTDVTIHGCGSQTRVASASLKPGAGASNLPWFGAQQKANGVHAVITVLASTHVEFRNFVVEAAANEAGILLDGADVPLTGTVKGPIRKGVVDVTVKDLVITAAKYPAILAIRAAELQVQHNRILFADVPTNWPAVFLSGNHVWFEQNVVTVQGGNTSPEFLPTLVQNDLAADAANSPAPGGSGQTAAGASTNVPAGHPGGVQIGGPSSHAYILENQIAYGARNGITLGSIEILDSNQNSTGTWTGVVVGGPDMCCTGTLTIGGSLPTGETAVNAGLLQYIEIHRNLILDTGLCGIGPVAYFPLAKQQEVITVEVISITQNRLQETVTRQIDTSDNSSLSVLNGYAAVALPDAIAVTIRDNTIVDFGAQPGVQVSGIFILHGEGVEIARNQIAETRDWSGSSTENSNSKLISGGIILSLANPPQFSDPASDSDTPIFEPGVRAAHIFDNTVRVALGQALAIIGTGPMSIVNNHLSTGGTVANSTIQLAQTVLLLNFGVGVEITSLLDAQSNVAGSFQTGPVLNTNGVSFSAISSGAVLFSNNVCQLEARESGQEELSSLLILSLDGLVFSNNYCWMDGKAGKLSGFCDALLAAGTLQVTGNRMQEPILNVLVSGIAVGVFNITSLNITTSCLLCFGSKGNVINANNLVVVDANAGVDPKGGYCAQLSRLLSSVPDINPPGTNT